MSSSIHGSEFYSKNLNGKLIYLFNFTIVNIERPTRVIELNDLKDFNKFNTKDIKDIYAKQG